jgi:hypothetical protein
MNDSRLSNREFVALQVESARKIVDAVSAAQHRLPTFRQAVREYARSVLGKVLQPD